MNIVKLDSSKVCVIDISEINNLERISSCFIKGYNIIYFTSNKEFLGVLSVGDFNKYYARQNDIELNINLSCKFVFDSPEALTHAEEIFKEYKSIEEIPVIQRTTKKIEYVYRKKENEFVDFDVDWSLVDIKRLNIILEQFEGIYVYGTDKRVENFINFIDNKVKVTTVENLYLIENLKEDDLLLFNSVRHLVPKNNKCTMMTIEQLYLSILGLCTIDILQRKGIAYYFFQVPIGGKIRKENAIYSKTNVPGLIDPDEIDALYGDNVMSKKHITNQDYNLLFLFRDDNKFLLKNCSSETFNVKDNLRVVPESPQVWERTIYVFGTCIVRGFYVDDEFTIPNLLQKKLLKEKLFNTRVVNFGGGGGLNDFSDIRDFMNMLSTDMKEKDIVIHIGYNIWEMRTSHLNTENYYELSWIINRIHQKRCFQDSPPHLTPYGNSVVADYIWEQIKHEYKEYLS